MKVFKQSDSMQCGIACLQMVCKYYGKEYTNDNLSKVCFATTEGVSLHGIRSAAQILGLKTLAFKGEVKELHGNCFPCILHWNQNHFVVLYKVSRNGKKFYVADPAKGVVNYSLEEFKKHWISTVSGGKEKGVAMHLEPTEDFGKSIPEDAKSERRPFRFLFSYIKQYRKYFAQPPTLFVVGCCCISPCCASTSHL